MSPTGVVVVGPQDFYRLRALPSGALEALPGGAFRHEIRERIPLVEEWDTTYVDVEVTLSLVYYATGSDHPVCVRASRTVRVVYEDDLPRPVSATRALPPLERALAADDFCLRQVFDTGDALGRVRCIAARSGHGDVLPEGLHLRASIGLDTRPQSLYPGNGATVSLDARIFPLSVRYIIGKLASDSGPHDGWIAVKLTASRSHIASVDFRGRIAFGRLAVETGQFHLDRRFVRVAVLTVRLRGAVG